jgi:hypothetical protein
VAPPSLHEGKVQIASGDLSEEDGLVVATLAGPIGVHRDRYDQVTARARMPPAGREGRPSGRASRRSPPYFRA